MLGIWCGGDWLKERFSLSQSMVGWYAEVPDLVGIFIANTSYSYILIHVYCCQYVGDIMGRFPWLLCWSFFGYMLFI